jgi:hypothetical protein
LIWRIAILGSLVNSLWIAWCISQLGLSVCLGIPVASYVDAGWCAWCCFCYWYIFESWWRESGP